MPAWILNCSVYPYLNCDGSTFSGTEYPALAAYLGGTTLPDARGRSRYALNQGTARITINSGYGLDGNTFLAGGGSQLIGQLQLPPYSPIFSGIQQTVTTSNTVNGLLSSTGVNAAPGASGLTGTLGQLPTVTFTPTGTIGALGSGYPTVSPGLVAGLTLIRAA
jgi:hypothetical protein